MKTYNNTNFEPEVIEKLPMLGTTISKWRERTIKLYQHPDDEDCVISVGISFDASMRVICKELKTDYMIALEYASHGKIYISE